MVSKNTSKWFFICIVHVFFYLLLPCHGNRYERLRRWADPLGVGGAQLKMDARGPLEEEQADTIVSSAGARQGFFSGGASGGMWGAFLPHNLWRTFGYSQMMVYAGLWVPSANVTDMPSLDAKMTDLLLLGNHFSSKLRHSYLCVFAALYVAALTLCFFTVYWVSRNDLPAKFYTMQGQMLEGVTIDEFLSAFNQVPKDLRLQVTGLVPSDADYGWYWRGQRYTTAFAFALDLTPWVCGDGPVSAPDRANILRFLNTQNNLEIAQIQSECSWADWEDLAVNIKHRVRQSGFDGLVEVHFDGRRLVKVYQNKPWAHFMRSEATKALCVLSLFGALFYFPYMWFRSRKVVLRTKFVVDVGITEYWNLIDEKLCCNGFAASGSHALRMS